MELRYVAEAAAARAILIALTLSVALPVRRTAHMAASRTVQRMDRLSQERWSSGRCRRYAAVPVERR